MIYVTQDHLVTEGNQGRDSRRAEVRMQSPWRSAASGLVLHGFAWLAFYIAQTTGPWVPSPAVGCDLPCQSLNNNNKDLAYSQSNGGVFSFEVPLPRGLWLVTN